MRARQLTASFFGVCVCLARVFFFCWFFFVLRAQLHERAHGGFGSAPKVQMAALCNRLAHFIEGVYMQRDNVGSCSGADAGRVRARACVCVYAIKRWGCGVGTQSSLTTRLTFLFFYFLQINATADIQVAY